MNHIEEFNRIRRILFSTFNEGEHGRINAFRFLENYKRTLDHRSYIGLKAELEFYKNYRKEYSLTLSAMLGIIQILQG